MPKQTDEGFLEAKARRAKGQRGKASERLVQTALTGMRAEHDFLDYSRSVDSRAAGRIVEAQVCDYTVFCRGRAYSLEVKSLQTGTRLKTFVQLPRMLRRAMAGVPGIVLVHLIEMDRWVMIDLEWFKTKHDAASWDVGNIPGTVGTDVKKMLRERFTSCQQ